MKVEGSERLVKKKMIVVCRVRWSESIVVINHICKKKRMKSLLQPGWCLHLKLINTEQAGEFKSVLSSVLWLRILYIYNRSFRVRLTGKKALWMNLLLSFNTSVLAEIAKTLVFFFYVWWKYHPFIPLKIMLGAFRSQFSRWTVTDAPTLTGN